MELSILKVNNNNDLHRVYGLSTAQVTVRNNAAVLDMTVVLYLGSGADLGGGCRGCAPPPPDDLRPLSN